MKTLALVGIKCAHIGAPRFGQVTSSRIVEYEGIVQFSCDVGYFLQGSETSTCLADGSWSDPLPSCTSTFTFFSAKNDWQLTM